MVFCNKIDKTSIKTVVNGHNPYFNRWFSAIYRLTYLINHHNGHNPYFNRWFSAISDMGEGGSGGGSVTILILIDGFLQYKKTYSLLDTDDLSQSLF